MPQLSDRNSSNVRWMTFCRFCIREIICSNNSLQIIILSSYWGSLGSGWACFIRSRKSLVLDKRFYWRSLIILSTNSSSWSGLNEDESVWWLFNMSSSNNVLNFFWINCITVFYKQNFYFILIASDYWEKILLSKRIT
jgi:hypothetical protein